MTISDFDVMGVEIARLRAMEQGYLILLKRLQAERAKAAEDSRRLDWAGKYQALFVRNPRGSWTVSWYRDVNPQYLLHAEGPTLRDAIDAGRKATGDNHA